MNDTMTRDDLALLRFIADMRAAAGDPTGKLMQDELVAHIAELRRKVEEYESESRAITALRIKIGEQECWLPANAHGIVTEALALRERFEAAPMAFYSVDEKSELKRVRLVTVDATVDAEGR